METYNLAETLEIEGYKKITLLPERYEDAFIGIDTITGKKAIYSAEILDKIDECEVWKETCKDILSKDDAPVIIKYCSKYNKYDIPDNMDDGAIGVSIKGKIAVLSRLKMIQCIVARLECTYDEADAKVEEFEQNLSKRKDKNILVVDSVNNYDDIYNILSYENYKIDEDDDLSDYDDDMLLKEIEQNIKLK